MKAITTFQCQFEFHMLGFNYHDLTIPYAPCDREWCKYFCSTPGHKDKTFWRTSPSTNIFFYKKHSIKKITSQIQQKQVKQVDKKSTNTTRKKQTNKEPTDNQTATNPNTQDQYITAFQPKPKHPFWRTSPSTYSISKLMSSKVCKVLKW